MRMRARSEQLDPKLLLAAILSLSGHRCTHREADSSMLELGSSGVAMEVTQPE
jgi:hypothetical protein